MEMDNKEAAKQAERLADDLLDGGAEIADFLRELGLRANTREVYHLHKTRRLPIGRLGRKLIASRSQLRRATKALTA
jgi:hypothetical protein